MAGRCQGCTMKYRMRSATSPRNCLLVITSNASYLSLKGSADERLHCGWNIGERRMSRTHPKPSCRQYKYLA
jgi:hypothetical protein